MAVRAHEIPVLVGAAPMQPIAGGNFLVRIQVKPALPTGLARPAVPGNSQRLQPVPRHSNQVLLQWRETKGVLNSIVMRFSVRPLRMHKEIAAAAEKSGGDSLV